MANRNTWRAWFSAVTILLVGVCLAEASEAMGGSLPIHQFTCTLPQAVSPVDVTPGAPVVGIQGLDKPTASALATSTGCWPSLGGICVYNSPNCRNDCGARYNTCVSTAGCTQEECYDMRLLCYECCAGWP